MNRTRIAAGALALGGIVLLAPLAQAQVGSAAAWLHVRVEEGKGSKVSVNLPLSVVEAALKSAPDTIATDGKFHVGRACHNLSVADMRRMWTELKNAGDTEIVSVEDKDETVKVARRGDVVQVRVDRPTSGEEVRVDVPVSLVDAALAGEGDSIDIKALVRELAKRRGDVVHVNEKDNKVRVWIDESNTGGGSQ